jgi:hypothetical protein
MKKYKTFVRSKKSDTIVNSTAPSVIAVDRITSTKPYVKVRLYALLVGVVIALLVAALIARP